MFRGRLMTVILALAVIFGFISPGQPALADWGVSFGGTFSTYGDYYGDRVTSGYRRGYQMDDWVERGSSSITESPIYADGVRLSAWATWDEYEEDYEYAIASAIYYFDIPPQARSIRIKIYYDGESDRDDLGNEIAGRVWIRRSTMGDDYEEYYPREGRYEDVDQPLYGDTFALPARKHLEIIRISASDHTDDGMMELHIVAEGRQQIDVKYIEVESYTFMPTVRVITRYYSDYMWRPWHDYTYWYFYSGPVFHPSDYYYVRYIYPNYTRYYVEIRTRYNNYLRIYYVRRPHYHVRWADVVRVHRGGTRSWDRDRLNKWTPVHEEARKSYTITSTKTRRSVEVRQTRERIRSALSSSSRLSPSAVRASSGESVQTRGSSVTEMKRKRESSDVRTEEPRSSERAPARTETRDTKTRRDEVRSSTKTEKSPEQESSLGSEKQVPPKSQEQQKREDTQVKKKREASRSSETKREESRKVEKAPPKESAPKDSKVEDDDDEDEKDKKSKRSSSSGSSTTRERVRKKK